jgi:hypothetical protein
MRATIGWFASKVPERGAEETRQRPRPQWRHLFCMLVHSFAGGALSTMLAEI